MRYFIIIIFLFLSFNSYAEDEQPAPAPLLNFAKEELSPELNNLALSLRKNLILLEQECTRASITERSEIFFSFTEKDQNKAEIKIIPPGNEKEARLFYFSNIVKDKEDNVLAFNMQESDSSQSMPRYIVRNTMIDDKGLITVRITLKTIKMPVPGKETIIGNKFIQGIAVNYKYNDHHKAFEYAKRDFIILPSGSFRTIMLKESLNRTFTEEGFLSGETVRETKYSYQEPVNENYAVFNPVISTKGMLTNFDIHFMPRISLDSFSANEAHFERYNITLLPRDHLNRMGKRIKSFRFTESNESDVFEVSDLSRLYDPENRMKASLEVHYKKYISKEENLFFIPDLINVEYNADFNKQLVTRKNSLSLKAVNEGYKILSSRKTEVSYKDNLSDSISVAYYDVLPPFNKDYLRKADITILERSEKKLPEKISLKLYVPGEETPPIEQEIIQDCNYIIKQSLNGKLFTPDVKDLPAIKVNMVPEILAKILPVPLELDREEGIVSISMLAANTNNN